MGYRVTQLSFGPGQVLLTALPNGRPACGSWDQRFGESGATSIAQQGDEVMPVREHGDVVEAAEVFVSGGVATKLNPSGE